MTPSANQQTTTLKQIREMISNSHANSEPLDIKTRDLLLFGAIIDIYDQLETMSPAITFYKFGLWFATALGTSILALIFGIMIGKVELIFK